MPQATQKKKKKRNRYHNAGNIHYYEIPLTPILYIQLKTVKELTLCDSSICKVKSIYFPLDKPIHFSRFKISKQLYSCIFSTIMTVVFRVEKKVEKITQNDSVFRTKTK